MNIKITNAVSDLNSVLPELRQLLKNKYEGNKVFPYFLSDYEKSFLSCINNENISLQSIALYEEGELLAHVALIIDKRLPKTEAFFGFFECSNEVEVMSQLWKTLNEKAKNMGINMLKGPVNGSVWYQYRCLKETDGSPLFKTEVVSEKYYYNLLKSKNPKTEINFFSASREPYDIVLKMISADSLDKLLSNGFSIKVVKNVNALELRTVAQISKAVFKDNWGYTELTEKEFINLYSTQKLDEHLNSLYLLFKGEEIIGFCSTFIEDEMTLILKTICILPEYRGLGLGNALAYKIHHDAKNMGIKKIIYALIREGNSISNFPKEGAVVFRSYAAFEFEL